MVRKMSAKLEAKFKLIYLTQFLLIELNNAYESNNELFFVANNNKCWYLIDCIILDIKNCYNQSYIKY